ncbi:MAG: mobile mystery protein A [Hyphomicrobiaceae bacterium]
MRSNLRSARLAVDRLHKTTAPLARLAKLPHGWIATVRSALGMSQETLGARLNIPKQRMSQLEMRERTGDIKLSQLRDAADALNCDLVYAFVPREPLEELVQRRARERALREIAAVERSMQLEDQATGIDEDRIRDYIARHIDEKDLWRDG